MEKSVTATRPPRAFVSRAVPPGDLEIVGEDGEADAWCSIVERLESEVDYRQALFVRLLTCPATSKVGVTSEITIAVSGPGSANAIFAVDLDSGQALLGRKTYDPDGRRFVVGITPTETAPIRGHLTVTTETTLPAAVPLQIDVAVSARVRWITLQNPTGSDTGHLLRSHGHRTEFCTYPRLGSSRSYVMLQASRQRQLPFAWASSRQTRRRVISRSRPRPLHCSCRPGRSRGQGRSSITSRSANSRSPLSITDSRRRANAATMTTSRNCSNSSISRRQHSSKLFSVPCDGCPTAWRFRSVRN